ncbi:MAG: hypothetical protein AAGM22_21295 [Acidobacteriota bacterium]
MGRNSSLLRLIFRGFLSLVDNSQGLPSEPGARRKTRQFAWVWLVVGLGIGVWGYLTYQGASPGLAGSLDRILGMLAVPAGVVVALFFYFIGDHAAPEPEEDWRQIQLPPNEDP